MSCNDCWSNATIRVTNMFRRQRTPPKPSVNLIDWPRKPIARGAPALQVLEVDPCLSENGATHRTGMYDLMRRTSEPQLVIRRGTPFRLGLTFNRPMNHETDHLALVFTHKMARYPSLGRRTRHLAPVSETGSVDPKLKASWVAVASIVEDNTMILNVIPPGDCIIGEWLMEIDCVFRKEGANTFKYEGSIFVLFNPWFVDDPVFMEPKSHKKEYLQADTGLIWQGACNRLEVTGWKFGQYDHDILQCSLFVLQEVSGIPLHHCDDPTLVVRAISSAVNSVDNHGVLHGNWTNDYSNGKNPSSWVGSTKILQQYYKHRRPVRYGQCWVFGGVSTTIHRALGIPSRVVTCYNAAQDFTSSVTVDKYVDDDGRFIREYGSDIVWNYHVWNEVWTKRSDLDSKHHGWQAADSTPQAVSDSLFRCGPASPLAVKSGDVKLPFDVEHIFTSVNADIVHWRYQGPTQPLKLLAVDTTYIGCKISTKAVGLDDREDITDTYKFPEKSKEERAIYYKVLAGNPSAISRYYLNESFNDVTFDFELVDDITIGKSFRVCLNVRNVSEKEYRVCVILRSTANNYTGQELALIRREERSVIVPAHAGETIETIVLYENYQCCFTHDSSIAVSALCKVDGTDYEYFAHDDFRIVLPSIEIEVMGEPAYKETFYGSAYFVNPLPEKLRNCVFMIEGPGIDKGLKFKIDDVPPHATAKVNFKMSPIFYGKQKIIARFYSSNLHGVSGYSSIYVKKPGV